MVAKFTEASGADKCNNMRTNHSDTQIYETWILELKAMLEIKPQQIKTRSKNCSRIGFKKGGHVGGGASWGT